MRSLYVLTLIAFTSSCISSSNKNTDSTKPNVIIILADDLGYKDVGFNGSPDIKTPNIDRIAKNGVVFTNGYVSYAVCGPSRAGLITGRYQDRFGFSRNPLFAPKDIEQGLPLNQQTIAEALETVGYQNMAIGKWHLGAHEKLRPLNRGFHEFFGFLSGGHRYFPSEWTLKDISEVKTQYGAYKTKLLQNDTRIEEDAYLTDALSREAVNFVKRNKEQPFFLYLAYNAPHGPLQATQKYLNRHVHLKDDKRKTYAAMVSAMDDGVGNLLDQLESLNISDNTLIFFLSDNGGQESLGANNGELNKGKGSLYEGGVRVPFAMQWPDKIDAGGKYEQPIISLDIFATISEVTGMVTKNELDGVNILPYLNGALQGSPHSSLYWRKFNQNAIAVRSANRKLINEQGTSSYFDLNTDIGEEKPLEGADAVKEMTEMHQRWNADNVDPIFIGLGRDKLYTKQHPDRFENVEKY